MKSKIKLFVLTGLVLMATLLLTSTAFAEGEEPPSTPVVDEPLPLEASPPPEPQNTTPMEETLPVVEEPEIKEEELPLVVELGSEPPIEEPPSVEALVIEIPAEELPDEKLYMEEPLVEGPTAETDILPLEDLSVEETLANDLVLVDEAGLVANPVLKSSEQLINADPYFTTGGGAAKYCFVANGICAADCDFCNGTPGITGPSITNPIQSTIDYIGTFAMVPDSGVINIEKALYYGSVVLDQSLPNLLNITWLNGIPDGLGVKPTIIGTLTISNLTTSFRVEALTITGGLTIKDANITVGGGHIFVNDVTGPVTIRDSITTNGNIDVNNSTGSLTLSNLDVRNTAGYGISVINQKGAVTLTSVKSSNNLSYGALINNSGAPGNVTITNCAFDHNNGGTMDEGLRIFSIGLVSINGLSASYNGEAGLHVESFSNLILRNAVLMWNIDYGGCYLYTTKAAPVLMENVTSGNNHTYGLNIITSGTVTLRSIDTFGNGSIGIDINNSAGTGSVNLTGIRTSGNTSTGLVVQSRSSITITTITAEGNGGNGAYLDNCHDIGTGCTGNGNVTITSPASAGIAGANSFINTIGGSGLVILSKGSVTLTNLDAYNNSNYGADINNSNGTGSIIINKTLPNWANGFCDNSYHGLNLATKGVVLLNDSIAYGNGQNGINISGMGNIILTNVAAHDNGISGSYSGLYITNTTGTGGVIIHSTVLANYMDFSQNTYTGINITSRGAVSVASVIVNNNTGGSGLYIENYTHPTLAPAVTISYGQFNNNYYSGIVVYSKGAITLTNVEACDNHNGQNGVHLSNGNHGTSSPVTIRSTSTAVFYYYCNNPANGIYIYSDGAVSVSNVISEWNGDNGIAINNSNSIRDYPVSISNSRFDNNGANGISINSRGAITLTNVSACHNGSGYFGATLNNWSGFGLSGVTIRSTVATVYYEFSFNDLDGIYIFTEGPVSVSNVIARENNQNGLNINRHLGLGAITITRGTFNDNGHHGLLIESTISAITLTDVTASHNDPDPTGANYSGVAIDATYGTIKGGSVIIRSSRSTSYYDFSFNSNCGLAIFTTGSVYISNAIAEENLATNVYIDNQYASDTAPKPVSVLFTTANKSDTGCGIKITTKGNVILNTLTANENFDRGLDVYAYNSFCLIPANVTLIGAGSQFNNNHNYGVRIDTEGNIYLYNVAANGTIGGDGISLYNNYTGSTGNVTISAYSTFYNSSSENDDDGLNIVTRGIVSISRLISSNNNGDGARIDNSYSSPLIKTVTITTCEFNWNRGDYSLIIESQGAVTLNTTHVDSNEHSGILIQTDGTVTFNGVSASYNSTHDEEIPYANATINERLTSDVAGDIWRFTAATVSHTITLTSTDFDAYLMLYHFNTGTGRWDLVEEDDNDLGGNDAKIIANLVNGDQYLILATTANGWGEPGEYTLGFNGPGTNVPKEQFYGASIRNHTGTGNVTITSPSTFWSAFNENNWYGVHISTYGVVSITNTSASDNGDDGINITNPSHVTIRNTSTSNMRISNNGGFGIYLPDAYGNIILSGRIFLNSNGKFGAYLNNSSVPITTPMNVTVLSITANGNKMGDGIYITSKGQVTLSNITACNNSVNNAGVYISNNWDAMRNVIITGSNIFSDNTGGKGLEVNSQGVIIISGVRAEANGIEGIYISGSGTNKGVTLSNIISQYNGSTGLAVYVKGTVIFTNVRSNLNQGSGILVNANNGYHIYFNYCTIIGNRGNGIYAMSNLSWLHLVGTNYYGNDTDNSGDYNFYHY